MIGIFIRLVSFAIMLYFIDRAHINNDDEI